MCTVTLKIKETKAWEFQVNIHLGWTNFPLPCCRPFFARENLHWKRQWRATASCETNSTNVNNQVRVNSIKPMRFSVAHTSVFSSSRVNCAQWHSNITEIVRYDYCHVKLFKQSVLCLIVYTARLTMSLLVLFKIYLTVKGNSINFIAMRNGKS